MSKALISELQRAISVRGFDAGRIDGSYGPTTHAAVMGMVRAYDIERGENPSGAVRPPIIPPAPDRRVRLPADWLPKAVMKRSVLHWTGGTYRPNSTDLEAYHFVVDGDGVPHRGKHPISANVPPLLAGRYAMHAGGFNSYAIGTALAGMAGAVERPYKAGPYPIKREQWLAAADMTAQCCVFYGIPVSRDTVVTHAEVLPRWGAGIYKWDFTVLPFEPEISIAGHQAAGDYWRDTVAAAMEKL